MACNQDVFANTIFKMNTNYYYKRYVKS